MRTQNLIEAAQLHTLGLLDDDDAATFETALSAASPGVQSQVRREQARLAQLHAVLPEVEPRPELRGIVLEAIRREAALKYPASPEAIRHAAARLPKIVSGRRVSRVWRTAAVSLAAIAVVLSVFTVFVKVEQTRLQARIENDQVTSDTVKALAPQFAQELLFGAPENRIRFTSDNPTYAKACCVVVNADNARFFYNLPSSQGEVYQLVAMDSNGAEIEVPVLSTFNSSGGIHSEPIKLNKGMTQLAIKAGVRGADQAIKWTVVATARLT